MYKYQNKSNQDQIIPGIGFVVAGGEIETASPIENPNFELINETQNQTVIGTEAPQPSAVVEAVQVTDPNAELEIK